MNRNTSALNKFNSLSGKTVVITGASSGVGKAIALEMAMYGANIVVAARREEALQTLVSECETMRAKALAVTTDVTDYLSVSILAQSARNWGGKIDVWINNAGLLGAGNFEEIPVEVNHKIVETNLVGYMYGAQAVLPIFKEQGYGILINNISVGGWFPVPYAAAYSASKFGITGFSQALKGEYRRWPHIHICEVFPAFLDTPGIRHAANFTGKVLKPAPPVYDPQKVAWAMVKLVNRPKPTTLVGMAAPFLRYAHALSPAISRNATAMAISAYLKHAKAAPLTPGNVLQPLQSGTTISGGWMMPARRKKKLNAILALAGFAAGIVLFSRRK